MISSAGSDRAPVPPFVGETEKISGHSAEVSFVDRAIERFGEATWAKMVCAFTGSLGVMSGFFVFVLWWEQIHAKVSAGQFTTILVLAALFSLIFEFLRSQVEDKEEPWYLHRIVTSFVVLAIFELCVMGAHSAASLYLNAEEAEKTDFVRVFLGDILADPAATTASVGEAKTEVEAHQTSWRDTPVLNAIAVAVLWLVLGAALAWRLGEAVLIADQGPAPPGWRSLIPVGRGALAGGKAGFVYAPLGMLLYIGSVRMVRECFWMITKPGEWERSIRSMSELAEKAPVQFRYILQAAFAIIRFAGSQLMKVLPRFGPVVLLSGLVIVAALLADVIRKKKPSGGGALIVYTLFAATVFVIVAPLLSDIRMLARILLVVAVGWGATGFILGAIIPALSGPSEQRKDWSIVAFVAAAVLAMATVVAWRIGSGAHAGTATFVFAAGAVFFLLAGLVLPSGTETRNYWVILALSVATLVFGVTQAFQHTGFLDMHRQAYFLVSEPPLNVADTRWAQSMVKSKLYLPPIPSATFHVSPDLLSWALTRDNLLAQSSSPLMFRSVVCDRDKTTVRVRNYQEHAIKVFSAGPLVRTPENVVKEIESEGTLLDKELADAATKPSACLTLSDLFAPSAVRPTQPEPVSNSQIEDWRGQVKQVTRAWIARRKYASEIDPIVDRVQALRSKVTELEKTEPSLSENFADLTSSGDLLIARVDSLSIEVKRWQDAEARATGPSQEVQGALVRYLGAARDWLENTQSELRVDQLKIALLASEQRVRRLRSPSVTVVEQGILLNDLRANHSNLLKAAFSLACRLGGDGAPSADWCARLQASPTPVELASMCNEPAQPPASMTDAQAGLRLIRKHACDNQQKIDTWLERSREQLEHTKNLEVAMTSSVGFWVTIGMLAAWSVRLKRESVGRQRNGQPHVGQ